MNNLFGLLPLILLSSAAPLPEGKAPRIRVLLEENSSGGSLKAEHSLHVVIPGRNTTFRVLPPFPQSQVICRNGRIQVGSTHPPKGEILLVPEWSGTIRWNGKAYHGSLLLRPASSRQFHVINIVNLEDYVTGVLPTEMGAGAPVEALKAQAICARTYAYARMNERHSSGFDTYADVRDQVYGGIPARSVFADATRATRGQLLFHKSKPVKAYFHSTCGGETESVFSWRGDPEIKPLSGSSCGSCSGARWFRWNAHLSREEVKKALAPHTGNKLITKIRIANRNDSNRIGKITIRNNGSTKFDLTGAEFRTLLGANIIRSTNFIITPTQTGWSISGRGWGHGVGLCQEGAMGMARKGANFRSILLQYYPGTNLKREYD